MSRPKRTVGLMVLLAASLVGLAQGGDPPRELLVCYPGMPGDTEAAKGTMSALAEHLQQTCGWAPGSLTAIYFNAEKPAAEHVRATPPRFGILGLSVYLKWKKAGSKLTVLATSERKGATVDRFHLLVPRDSAAKTLADLKGKTIASSYLEDRAFANVVFGGALDASSGVAIVDTRLVLSAARACGQAKPIATGQTLDGLVVDDYQLEGLQASDRVWKNLKSVWTSRDLPAAVVVAFEGDAAETKKLTEVLLSLAQDAAGRRVLEAIQATGFKPANQEAYSAAEKAYAP